jgi:hypothetical protein
MKTNNRTTIELHPIATEANKTSNGDDWLNNNSVELINTKVDPKIATHAANGVTHHCAQLMIHCEGQRFFVESQLGEIELATGDILVVSAQRYQVIIRQIAHSMSPMKAAVRHAMPDAISDDIWGNSEDRLTQPVIIDPFVKKSQPIPILPKTIAAPVISTPIMSVPTQHDPLDFLYHQNTSQHDPNYLLPVAPTQSYIPFQHNAPGPASISTALLRQSSNQTSAVPQGDVLRDLNIDPNQPNRMQAQHVEPGKSFLEEAPIEHLDQYLTHDDERYWRQGMSESVATEPALVMSAEQRKNASLFPKKSGFSWKKGNRG